MREVDFDKQAKLTPKGAADQILSNGAPAADQAKQPSRHANEIAGVQIARNMVINLGGYVLPLAVGLAATPYIVRKLGPDRFGVLSIAWVLLGYFTLFDMGLGRATTKFVAECLSREENDKLPGFVWTSVWIQVLVGFAGALVLAAVTPFLVAKLRIPPPLTAEARATFFILDASLPILIAVNTLRGVLEAGQRFDLVNYVKVPSTTSIFLFPLMALPFGAGLPTIVLLLVLGRLASCIAYYLMCVRLFPVLRQRHSIESTLLRPLLSYGGWVTVSNVISPILVYLDRFLIGYLVSVAAVGYYSAPFEVINRFTLLPTSLVATLFPAFATLDAGGSRTKLEEIHARSIKSMLVTLGPALLLVFIFAPDLLRIWLGPEFAQQSSAAAQILAIGILVNCVGFLPYSLLQAVGRPDLTAKLHLLELPLYVVLLVSLTRSMGIPGAALACSLRLIIDTGLLLVVSWRLGFVRVRSLAHYGVLTSAAAVLSIGATSVLILVFAQAMVVRASLAAVQLLLFAFFIWSFALDTEDKKLVTAMTNLSWSAGQFS